MEAASFLINPDGTLIKWEPDDSDKSNDILVAFENMMKHTGEARVRHLEV